MRPETFVTHRGRAKSLVRAALLAPRALTGQYRSGDNPEQTECLLVLSFGFTRGIDGRIAPGLANEELAREAELAKGVKVLLAQSEVYDALQLDRNDSSVLRLAARENDQYFDTHAFFERCKPILAKLGCTHVLILAHPHHVPRTQAVAMASGLTFYTPRGLRPVWDQRSEQAWTRNAYAWAWRESSALFLYAWRGWL